MAAACHIFKKRTMWLIIFVLLNLLILFSSHLLCYRLRQHNDFSLHLVSSFLVYIVQITLSIILMGAVFKSLTPLTLGLFNAALSMAIILLWRSYIKASMNYLYRRAGSLFRDLRQSKDLFLYVLLVLFLVQAAVTIIKIYYLPPHVGDVLSYHLHPVAEWFQQGQLTNFTDSPVYRGNQNPLGAKFLHLWFILFKGDITWIQLPQFLFGLMLALSSYSLMLRMNIKRWIAMKMAVLIYFIPAVLLQSRTCQDHLIHAACSIAALLFLTDVVFKKRYEGILFLGLTLAFLFGIKKHSPVVIATLFPALLISRGWNWRKVKEFLLLNRWPLIAGGSLVIASAAYFILSNPTFLNRLINLTKTNFSSYLFKILLPLIALFLLGAALKLAYNRVLRKWPQAKTLHRRPPVIAAGVLILTGAAVFAAIKYYPRLKPFLTGHQSPLMRTNRQAIKKFPLLKSKFVKNLLSFPFRIKDIGMYTPYTPDLLEKSGFGIQFFAFGLLAYLILVPTVIFKKAYRNSVMGFLLIFSVLLLIIYFFSYYSWANYRSFMFFAITGLMLWAYIQSRWLTKKYYRYYIGLLMVGMALFNGLVCFFEGNQYADRWKTTLTAQPAAQRTVIKYGNLLKTWNGRGGSWDFIGNHIAPDEAIGYSGGEDAWTFPYFGNRLERKIYYLASLPGFKTLRRKKGNTSYRMLQFTPDFRASLKQRGIHYIHFSTQGTPHRQKLFIANDSRGVVRITPHLYYVEW